MRKLRVVAVVGTLGLIFGCGGGGGGGGVPPGGGIPGCVTGVAPAPGGNSIAPSAVNVAAITVDGGLPNNPYANGVFTSVMVCQPGATKGGPGCQNIDHVLVDTGSYGLRLLQGPKTATAGGELTISLPSQVDGSGNLMAECAQFSDGTTWGSVRMADVYISGESAPNVPVQVIGDSNSKFATVPSACTAFGSPENDLTSLLANGIIGVGPFPADCDSPCSGTGLYYACSASSGCTTNSQPTIEAIPLPNPVAKFAADNNGVIMEMPNVPSGGAAVVNGSLVFGIGTQSNNGLGNATMFTGNIGSGNITTSFGGQTFAQSFIDSGSNGYFFSSSIATCQSNSGFYCPTSNLSCSATNTGANGKQKTVNFSVVSADMLSGADNAFNNLAGPNSPSPGSNAATGFDWGMPFFYGRNVYTGIEQVQGGNLTQAPYYAF